MWNGTFPAEAIKLDLSIMASLGLNTVWVWFFIVWSSLSTRVVFMTKADKRTGGKCLYMQNGLVVDVSVFVGECMPRVP